MNRRQIFAAFATAAAIVTQIAPAAAQGFLPFVQQQQDQRGYDVIDRANNMGFRVYPGSFGPVPQPTVIVGSDGTRRLVVMRGNDRDPQVCAYVSGIFRQYAAKQKTVSSPLPDGRGRVVAVFGNFDVKADDLGDGRGVALVTHPDRVTRVDYNGRHISVTTTFNDLNASRLVPIGHEFHRGNFYYFARAVDKLAESTEQMAPLQGLDDQSRGYLAESIFIAMLKDQVKAAEAYAAVNRSNDYAKYYMAEVSPPPPGAPRYPLEVFFGGQSPMSGYRAPSVQDMSPYGAPDRPAPTPSYGVPSIPRYGQ